MFTSICQKTHWNSNNCEEPPVKLSKFQVMFWHQLFHFDLLTEQWAKATSKLHTIDYHHIISVGTGDLVDTGAMLWHRHTEILIVWLLSWMLTHPAKNRKHNLLNDGVNWFYRLIYRFNRASFCQYKLILRKKVQKCSIK